MCPVYSVNYVTSLYPWSLSPPGEREIGLVLYLVVVFLAIDVTTGVIQFPLNFCAFLWREIPVRFGRRFISSNPLLLLFQSHGFMRGELAALNSLTDSLLLVLLALIDVRLGERHTSEDQEGGKASCQGFLELSCHRVLSSEVIFNF